MCEHAAQLPLSDLPPGAVVRVMVGDEPVAVCNVEGEVYAISDRCAHAEASLSAGSLEGHLLYCPWHAAAFDVRTGRPTGPPADRPCATFDVSIEGDTVTIASKK